MGDWHTLLIVILILWLSTGLRFYRLETQSFWNDEGNSARLSERSLDLIIEGTASDIHPPLYYIILHGWRELAGESEFGLRSFSAYAGLLVVAATFALGRLFYRQHAGPAQRAVIPALIATFLAALNPALVYYSQETRMYSLLALLTAVSTILLWRWLNSQQGGAWAAGYISTAAAGLYTHYFFPAVLILQNLIVLLWLYHRFRSTAFSPIGQERRRSPRHTIIQWLVMMSLVFLLYLPWLPIFWRQAGGRPAIREPIFQFLWNSVNWLSFGETVNAVRFHLPIASVTALLVWALLVGRRHILIPFMGTVVPLLFMYAAGTTQAAFFKFMLTAAPFFVLLLAGSLTNPQLWLKRKWMVAIPLLLFIPFLWGTGKSLSNLYHDPNYRRADYRGIAQRIADEAHPNAGIILNAPNQWEVFTYYYREGAPVYPLPKGQPDPAIIEPQLAEIANSHERLYVLYWGDNQRDPQHVVESWLEANSYKAAEEWVGDVRFVIYAVPRERSQLMETSVELKFGNDITLQGYSLYAEALSPGEILQLTLFWQAAESLDKRYKIFLHLLDENGILAAQSDNEPGGGMAPTSSWPAGETIVDNHGLLLPTDLASGMYTLVIGLYDITDPAARLPLQEEGVEANAWTVDSIKVE